MHKDSPWVPTRWIWERGRPFFLPTLTVRGTRKKDALPTVSQGKLVPWLYAAIPDELSHHRPEPRLHDCVIRASWLWEKSDVVFPARCDPNRTSFGRVVQSYDVTGNTKLLRVAKYDRMLEHNASDQGKVMHRPQVAGIRAQPGTTASRAGLEGTGKAAAHPRPHSGKQLSRPYTFTCH